MLRSEGLPADAFEASARVLTGSSLKAQMRELIERRKNQVPVAEEDEAAGWARFVAVHNAHRFDPPLLDAEPEVELGRSELPTDQREVIDVTAREMALGIASKVDAVMRLRNLSRDGRSRYRASRDRRHAVCAGPDGRRRCGYARARWASHRVA